MRSQFIRLKGVFNGPFGGGGVISGTGGSLIKAVRRREKIMVSFRLNSLLNVSYVAKTTTLYQWRYHGVFNLMVKEWMMGSGY